MVPLLLLPALLLSADASGRTFRQTDPATGAQVECERCPPGTYLRGRCTAAGRADCAPCPSGSFTELWNYIGKCLRCGVCGQNQVEKAACTASRDTQCQCGPGFYFQAEFDMCVRHRECPPGQGALRAGTASRDTVCYPCPSDTFSSAFSAQQNCTAHRSCRGSGLQLLLPGSARHDEVCVNCTDLSSRDGATYLREILLDYFTRISTKTLSRVLDNLPSEAGQDPAETSSCELPDLLTKFTAWVASATAEQLRQLPATLKKVGANCKGERLERKLRTIDSNLSRLCARSA